MVPKKVSSADGNRVRNPSVTTNGEKSAEATVNRLVANIGEGQNFRRHKQYHRASRIHGRIVHFSFW